MKNPIIIQDYLEDVAESARRITKYTQDMDLAKFEKSQITQDAVIRAFEVLGEATKKIPEDFRKKYPEIPWREMAATRDKFIHDYRDIEIEIVWRTAKEDIPEILAQISKII